MFITEAYAQTAGAAGAGGDPTSAIFMQMLPILLVVVVFYFLILRPQQQQRKRLQEMLAALKKNDVVVTQGGLIGKVKSVAEDEVRIEFGPNVEIRVVRAAIAEVRSKTDPAPANDSKPAAG